MDAEELGATTDSSIKSNSLLFSVSVNFAFLGSSSLLVFFWEPFVSFGCVFVLQGGCRVTPAGYGQMTHLLSSLAGGRLVLVLEVSLFYILTIGERTVLEFLKIFAICFKSGTSFSCAHNANLLTNFAAQDWKALFLFTRSVCHRLSPEPGPDWWPGILCDLIWPSADASLHYED